MQTGDAFFTAPDGLRLYRQWRRPDGAARGAVMLTHGFGEYSGHYYEALTSALVARGFAAHGWDLRGHGRSPGRWGWVRRWREYTDDLAALQKIVAQEEAGRPLFLFGHSMGAIIVLDHALAAPEGLAGIALTGPVLGPSQLSWWRDLIGLAFDRLWPSLQINAGLKLEAISDLPEVQQFHATDPLFHPIGTPRLARELERAKARVNAAAPRWRLPLFIQHGELDPIALPGGGKKFVANCPAGDVTLLEIPGMPHHLLNCSCAEAVAARIVDWMEQRCISKPVVSS